MWKKILSLSLALSTIGTPIVLAQTSIPLDSFNKQNRIEFIKEKSRRIAKSRKGKFTKDKYDIEIVSISQITNGISVYIKAWENGNQIAFSDGTVEIERVQIINPPVLIPDPTGTIIRRYKGNNARKYVQRFKEDPEQALRIVLNQTLNTIKKFDDSRMVQGKKGQTITVVYPDANPETTSVDGFVQKATAAGNAWSVTHDASTADTADDSSTTFTVDSAESGAGASQYTISRGITQFDLSAVTGTVSSCTIDIWPTSREAGDADAQAYISFVTVSPASETSLATGDYDAFTTTKQTDDLTITDLTAGQYNTWTCNATGVETVDAATILQFGIREGHDIEDQVIANNSANRMIASSADNTGTTQDPKITIESSGGGVTTPKQSGWDVWSFIPKVYALGPKL